MAERHVELVAGTTAGFSALGDPLADRLILLCHATPGAAGFDPDPQITETWGVHILTLDRPGYGSTDPAVPFTAASWADDVAAYLLRTEATADSISSAGFGTVGVVGWREGGFFAAALAARHPHLVDRIAFVGTPRPSALRDLASLEPARMLDLARFSTPRTEADGAAYRRRVERMLNDAGLQGTAGIASDFAAFSTDETDYSTITAENLYLYGARDDLATIRDADWFTESAPNTTAYRSDGSGRDLISVEWARILAHVAPDHGRIDQSAGPRT